MKIAVIGTGYVGLVAAAGFSNLGNIVKAVDKDSKKIDLLNNGEIPIYEPGLDLLVSHNVKAGRLSFTTDLIGSIEESDIILIAVGTPSKEDGRADLSSVFSVAETIGKAIEKYTVVMIKSTVPVGTNDNVAKIIASKTNAPFDVVSNPEFLKEGTAVNDFLKPDRVVIGVRSEKAKEIMKELYSPIMRTSERIYFMDPKSAEMTKYVANAYLATRISFINEIANLCEKIGANISHVRTGAGSDSRIGLKYFFPGCGYGGSCFPKDVRELLGTAEDNSFDLSIVKAAHNLNEYQKNVLYKKIISRFNGDLADKKIVFWGLSFKPETDDMRESPAAKVINSLCEIADKNEFNIEIVAHDPIVTEEIAYSYIPKSVKLIKDKYEAANGADALVVCTEWQEYRSIDFTLLEKIMRKKLIFDGRNIFDSRRIVNFEYYGIGTGAY